MMSPAIHYYTTFCSFADDIAILSSNSNPNTTSEILQPQLSQLESWSKSWGLNVYPHNL